MDSGGAPQFGQFNAIGPSIPAGTIGCCTGGGGGRERRPKPPIETATAMTAKTITRRKPMMGTTMKPKGAPKGDRNPKNETSTTTATMIATTAPMMAPAGFGPWRGGAHAGAPDGAPGITSPRNTRGQMNPPPDLPWGTTSRQLQAPECVPTAGEHHGHRIPTGEEHRAQQPATEGVRGPRDLDVPAHDRPRGASRARESEGGRGSAHPPRHGRRLLRPVQELLPGESPEDVRPLPRPRGVRPLVRLARRPEGPRPDGDDAEGEVGGLERERAGARRQVARDEAEERWGRARAGDEGTGVPLRVQLRDVEALRRGIDRHELPPHGVDLEDGRGPPLRARGRAHYRRQRDGPHVPPDGRPPEGTRERRGDQRRGHRRRQPGREPPRGRRVGRAAR